MQINNIIYRPVLTEKTTMLVQANVYSFEVNPKANKNQIAETLAKFYNVKVGGVKVVTRKGKVRRVGKKMQSKQLPNRKIAYVEVTEGKIDIFPKA